MKKICSLILSGCIPINPDACVFDCLTNAMLKAHEGRSSKVGIRKRKADSLRHFVLTPYYGETNTKQGSVQQVGHVEARILKSEYIRIHRGGNSNLLSCWPCSGFKVCAFVIRNEDELTSLC